MGRYYNGEDDDSSSSNNNNIATTVTNYTTMEDEESRNVGESSSSSSISLTSPSIPLTQQEEVFQDEPDPEISAAVTAVTVTTTTATTTTTPDTTTSNNNNNNNTISRWDACMHLIKGNLGPGCLNLPHAFAMSGWGLGLLLFLGVAGQGIYSMMLLTECKQLLLKDSNHENNNNNNDDVIQTNADTTTNTNIHSESHHHHHHRDGSRSCSRIHTFMDVANVTLGHTGQRIVQIFLFVLQTGVCCVFLDLLATNFRAQSQTSTNTSIVIVTFALLIIVWLRTLKDLRWLSTTANGLMIITIGTVIGMGIYKIHTQSIPLPSPIAPTTDLADVASFLASMFFAFEGIGLVLPVENTFATTTSSGSSSSSSSSSSDTRASSLLVDIPMTSTTSTTSTTTSTRKSFNTSEYYRIRILPISMSIVGFLFGTIGLFGSWGFPNMMNNNNDDDDDNNTSSSNSDSGSITAYLAATYPNVMWFQIVNILVMIAVFFTFPLQLTPALEVLDEWWKAWSSTSSSSSSCTRVLSIDCLRRNCIFCSRSSSRNRDHNPSNARHIRIDQQHDNHYEEEGSVGQPNDTNDVTVNGTSHVHSSTSSLQNTPMILTEESSDASMSNNYFSCNFLHKYAWIIPRYIIVVGCAVVVALVDDLSLLMSLFGAIGQTGLAMMPCVIHLFLIRQGIAPRQPCKALASLMTIGFCSVVMIFGLVVSIDRIRVRPSSS